MARPLRLHIPGRGYHVFTRGDNKARIFREDEDFAMFLTLVQRALNRFGAECVAFSLLDNHFHLLLIPHFHSVSRIMQYLNGTYAQWFNRKYGRVGHVFQGRFGSRIIDDAKYLLNALRYVAVNPIEGGCAQRPEDWIWGSHRATCGLDPAPDFLSLDRVWEAVNCADAETGRARYLAHIQRGKAAYDLHHALFFGGERLARQVGARLPPYRPVIAHTYAERYAVRPTIGSIFETVDSTSTAKVASAEAFHRHAYTLTEISEIVGRDPSTISKWIAPMRKRPFWRVPGQPPPGGAPPPLQAGG